MQPRTLAIIITILPLLISNAVYLLSAYEEHIPWCIPYIDGCTTISRAARSGNSIYLFRPTMIAYAVLLIWFWIMTKQWLSQLYGHTTKVAHIITWLGIIGAIFLIIYIDFLGTTGEINRFMRRHGIMIFFTFTPLAQLLLLNQHYKSIPFLAEKNKLLPVLRYQLIVLMLMLMIGITSIVLDIAQIKTDEIENIVEWNFSLLLNMYFLGMFFIWKNFRSILQTGATRD